MFETECERNDLDIAEEAVGKLSDTVLVWWWDREDWWLNGCHWWGNGLGGSRWTSTSSTRRFAVLQTKEVLTIGIIHKFRFITRELFGFTFIVTEIDHAARLDSRALSDALHVRLDVLWFWVDVAARTAFAPQHTKSVREFHVGSGIFRTTSGTVLSPLESVEIKACSAR